MDYGPPHAPPRWRRTSKTDVRTVSLPVEVIDRFNTMKADWPMLNLSKIAAVGISRVLDELNENWHLIGLYTNRE